MSPAIWADRSVLVTGCSGFLGAAVVQALAARSARVVGFVQHSAGEAVRGLADVVRGDIRDLEQVIPAFARHRIDVVFHLAALALPTVASDDPLLAFEVNARGTWNLLEAARRADHPPQIVLASTDSVYGENDGQAFTEAMPVAPDHPYEASKACAELAARCYGRSFGMPIATARFCNIYGPQDLTSSRLIAGTVQATLAGRRQALRSDGSALRNYLYVEDAVEALLTLAAALRRGDALGEAYNFCDEVPYSVLDIVKRILVLTGRPDLAPQLGGSTPGEISVKRASAAKAWQVLGWRPAVGIDEGLRRTIAWHRERMREAAP